MFLAHVMHEDDGGVKVALNFSEISEDGGDVGTGVFISAVQSDKRIEDEQFGSELFDGIAELVSVAV